MKFLRAQHVSVSLLVASVGVFLGGCAEKPPVVPQPQLMPVMPPAASAPNDAVVAGAIDPEGKASAPEAPGGSTPAATTAESGEAPTGEPTLTQVPEPVVAALPPMSPQAQAAFDQGLAAFKSADLAVALQNFTAATRVDPRAYRAHYALGTVQERLGATAAAMSAYEQSYAVQPDFVDGIVAHARMLGEGNNAAEAERLLTQRRSSLPKSAGLVAALAEVKSLMRDSATAQQLAQEALKIDSRYTPAMLVIARDHYRARRLDLALYALKAILDGFGEANPPRDKDSAEARLLRATIWLEQDRRVMAMNEFKAVMDLRPDLVLPSLRYATYLLESGGARDAIPLLQRVLRYDASNQAAHLGLGDAYRLTGDFARARQEFDWVRQQNGALAAVHYNTGLLYLFAPNMDGMTPKQQIEAAMAALNKFKETATKAELGDVEELLKRASLKKAEIDALAAANAPPAPPPPAEGGATPAPPPADGGVPPAGGSGSPPARSNGGN
ncbi:MAG: tetratricopeptide repeat protein [Deltaproteobacteria bacterium]|nr:tetratricopeptide repeat protein [Deltaproteobacteria bacterium]